MLTLDSVFKEYVAAGRMPAGGFKKTDLQGSMMHKKAKAIQKLFDLAEQNVAQEAKEYFKEFNVSFNLTSNEAGQSDENLITAYKQSVEDSQPAVQGDIVIPINIDFSKIGNKPPEQAYFFIYSSLRRALIKKRQEIKGDNGKLIKTDEVGLENEEGLKKEKTPEDKVKEYFMKKINEFFGYGDDDSYNKFAEQYKAETGKSLTESFFDFSNTSDVELACIEMNGKKAREALYGNDSILAVGYMQQSTCLAEGISDAQFNALVDGSDPQKLRDFCYNYASTFLSMSGLPNGSKVYITFENVGGLGTYYASQNRVNINLEKIAKKQSPTEVAMTLSHELTHAIDASQNKQFDKNGNVFYRLENNISENISAADNENDVVKSFVKEIKSVCYHVNPNERHARIGELSALQFMLDKNNGNEKIKATMRNSLQNYITYQENTIRHLENVANPAYISDLTNRYNRLSGSFKSDDAKKLVTDRFNYFRQLEAQNLLTTEPEVKSIEEARRILDQLEHGKVQQQTTQVESQLDELDRI